MICNVKCDKQSGQIKVWEQITLKCEDPKIGQILNLDQVYFLVAHIRITALDVVHNSLPVPWIAMGYSFFLAVPTTILHFYSQVVSQPIHYLTIFTFKPFSHPITI